MNIPKKYTKLVGTEQTFEGGLFSGKKYIKPEKYQVLDIRAGSALIVNVKELRETGKSSYEHPTFELLLKNKKMAKSRWSRPFPIREIDLAKKSKKKPRKRATKKKKSNVSRD